MIEELEDGPLKARSGALVKHLQRAFIAACELEREARSFTPPAAASGSFMPPGGDPKTLSVFR